MMASSLRFSPARQVPMLLVHVLPLSVLVWPAAFDTLSAGDFVLCAALYFIRMVGVTAGYHRYFSHRTFKMGRISQFALAFLAQSSAQKGVLWWAAHHRHHHRYSDMPEDIHSPRHGFFWSHMGWMLVSDYDETQWARIKDFSKFPELVFLNKHWWIPPATLATLLFAYGGLPSLVIGFFLSTTLLWHGTFAINSLAHVFGRRRYNTTDTSRNSFLLSVLTCGEGWHNNHHHFCASANQGFYWWEFDPSYYLIRLAGLLGLVWDIRTPPASVLVRNRVGATTPLVRDSVDADLLRAAE